MKHCNQFKRFERKLSKDDYSTLITITETESTKEKNFVKKKIFSFEV